MSRESHFSLPSDKRRRLLDRATTEYAESVALATTYLKGRGFDDETIEYWQLGYVFEPLPGHERFRGYLSIPYLTRAGTVALKFRCIEHDVCDGHPKYDSEAGIGSYLFGAQNFWVDSPFICVTEGELDAIACSVAGLPAVGVSGANKWQRHWSYCFEGYEDVIVLADGDKPGERLASNVGTHCNNARVITFPPGEDVNSFLIQHGPEALRVRILGNGG
jgi:DNA primase